MMAALTVTAITLGELLGSGAGAGAHASTAIGDLVLDSRAAHAGAAFVALRGGRDHGLRHAEDALARGAEVVLYDPAELGAEALPARVAARAVGVRALGARSGELARKLYGPAMSHIELAGVTGTNGKTTVAYLIAQAMGVLGRRCGYIGTLGHGLPSALEPHGLTTPDCFTLHRELAALAAEGGTFAALEVSSHALAQDRIAGLEIGTAAFTNLTRDHLDAHGSLEAYGEAKARLFERPGVAHAVLNANDAFARQLAARLARAVTPIRVAVRGYSSGNDNRVGSGSESRDASAHEGRAASGSESRDASGHQVGAGDDKGGAGDNQGGAGADKESELDIVARVRSLGLAGLDLELRGRFGDARLRSPLIGEFNAENVLVSLGVLAAWGVPLADACAALAECAPPPGRLETVGAAAPNAPHVVVDYAHTPDGLARVLETVRAHAPGEVWCVFGCGGERDPGKRAPMGAIAAAQADHIVITDDNPRGEDAAAIVRDILEGVGAHPSVVVEHDRAAAIRAAIRSAGAGDVVLIAGKGHETTQRIGAHERAFSDRDTARAALRELG